MTLTEIKKQIQQLDSAAFEGLQLWIVADERLRRRAKPLLDEQNAGFVKQLRKKGLAEAPKVPDNPVTIHDFEVWRVPGDAVSQYVEGDKVAHGVRVYEAVAKLPREEPSPESPDWRDVTEQYFPTVENEEKDAGVPHHGEGDAVDWEPGGVYKLGQLVKYKGKIYRTVVGVFQATDAPDESADYSAVGDEGVGDD